MRELALEESGVEQLDQSDAFTNIERIAQDCKFRNCDHEQSAGCAVLKALKTGELDSAEYHNFLKLQDESARRGKQVRRADRYRNQRTARADKQSREAYKEQLRRR
jgi:ribosome biogenesis GTPase